MQPLLLNNRVQLAMRTVLLGAVFLCALNIEPLTKLAMILTIKLCKQVSQKEAFVRSKAS